MTIAIENQALISGWVTPRAETILRRAIAIANDRGYNYLGVEHLALAIAEEPLSLPVRVWDGSMTVREWHDAIVENLPGLPESQTSPVSITVSRDPESVK